MLESIRKNTYNTRKMKLYNHVAEFEFPSIWIIFSICCLSRRRNERYERIIQQEKSKNEYLKFELKATKHLLIKSYENLLEHERYKLKEFIVGYEYAQEQYNRVKELKMSNDILQLQTFVSIDGTLENVEDDWKNMVDRAYTVLERQMKVFESVEFKIKQI